jgi:hypothetical protein
MIPKLKSADENETPICPYCKKILNQINFHENTDGNILTGITTNRIYFCPHCKSVLGTSHQC